MSTTAQHHESLEDHRSRNLKLAWLAVLVVAGAIAVAILLTVNDDGGTPAGIRNHPAVVAPPAGTRFDGGPDEGTPGVVWPAGGVRFDGGPDEGTPGVAWPAGGVRFDGGSNEGTRGVLVAPRASAPAPQHPLGAPQP